MSKWLLIAFFCLISPFAAPLRAKSCRNQYLRPAPASGALNIGINQVRYVQNYDRDDRKTVIIGVPGKSTSPEQFLDALEEAQGNAKCLTPSSRIIVVDFGNSSYNLLGVPLIGDLELNDILDAFGNHFGNSAEQIIFAGYSKGGQAIQRYSLVSKLNVNTAPVKFIVGCGSSYTFLDDKTEWIYGLNGFPAKFQPSTILQRIITSKQQYLLICGDQDFGSDDLSDLAKAQGNGRLEKITNLALHFKSLGIRYDFKTVSGVAHNYSLVIPRTGEFLC